MVSLAIISEWRERLARLCATRDRGQAASPWLVEFRIRILRFLLNRYGEDGIIATVGGAPNSTEESTVGVEPESPPARRRELAVRITYCIVEPSPRPPKSRDEIAGVVHRVHDLNRPRRRGFFWWSW